MYNILDRLSWLITVRPWVTLAVLVVVTVLLASGSALREPPLETSETLPRGSAVAEALIEIENLFGDSGDVRDVTLLFRGDALTPGGLAQMDALLGDIVSEPGVGELLAPPEPFVAPSMLVKALLQVDGFESVTQAEIDSASGPPQIVAALDAMTGTDADGTPVAVASIRLQDTGDERVVNAERRIEELASGDEGPLRVSSISYVVIEDESREATESGMAPLIGLALLLIAGLILLFMRTLSDLLLTLAGLLMSLIWIMGAEGWLGPNGLGLTGPPNSLTVMVPIIVIGLTVDYAIQTVSHYREQRAAGERVVGAVRIGLRNVIVPLLLAAVTTIVSLLAGLFSPVEIVGDFGIVAGVGIGLSLIVMLTLIPAGPNDHRPPAGGARNAAASPPYLGRIARHRAGGGAAGKTGHAQARAVHHRSGRGDGRARLRGQGHRVGVQHPRPSAQGWECAGGPEHPRHGCRRLDGIDQFAPEG